MLFLSSKRLRPSAQPVCRAHRKSQWHRVVRLQTAQQDQLQTSAAPPTLQPRLQPQHTQQLHDDVSCVATGMDVSCYLDTNVEAEAASAPGLPEGTPEQTSLTGAQQLAQMLLLASPFAFWGTSMVAMKSLMFAVPPLLMGSFRLLPAGLLLVGWAAAQGRPQPTTWKAWSWITAFALIDGAAFQGFLAIGLERTPAGLGSVIIDSQPLTVAFLASLLFGEQLGTVGLLSLLIGVAGLLLLELPEQYLLLAAGGLLDVLPGSSSSSILSSASSITNTAVEAVHAGSVHAGQVLHSASDVATSVWASLDFEQLLQMSSPSSWLASGEFWMLAAAQSMAVGTVMVRFVTKHVDPVMATGWHMVLGGAVLAVAALAQDPDVLGSTLSHLGPEDVAAAAYVSVLGGAASYGIFFWQASQPGNLTKLSSLTFLTPVFAAVTGYFVLGEVLTPPQLLGGAVTLASVLLINSNFNAKKEKTE